MIFRANVGSGVGETTGALKGDPLAPANRLRPLCDGACVTVSVTIGSERDDQDAIGRNSIRKRYPP
jgi:hypothetical protein